MSYEHDWNGFGKVSHGRFQKYIHYGWYFQYFFVKLWKRKFFQTLNALEMTKIWPQNGPQKKLFWKIVPWMFWSLTAKLHFLDVFFYYWLVPFDPSFRSVAIRVSHDVSKLFYSRKSNIFWFSRNDSSDHREIPSKSILSEISELWILLFFVTNLIFQDDDEIFGGDNNQIFNTYVSFF